ncbi:MAG: YihA family ribosome biogenesis GTP-binding protein, partial [Zavarzinia sp.]|nr:YihA family ribosome biogenesis GTP-binding protein [Zavarzinia sp.]
VSFQVVLTKTDKLKAGELDAMTKKVEAEIRPHVAAHPVIMPTSSETGAGIPELRAALAALGKPPVSR